MSKKTSADCGNNSVKYKTLEVSSKSESEVSMVNRKNFRMNRLD